MKHKTADGKISSKYCFVALVLFALGLVVGLVFFAKPVMPDYVQRFAPQTMNETEYTYRRQKNGSYMYKAEDVLATVQYPKEGYSDFTESFMYSFAQTMLNEMIEKDKIRNTKRSTEPTFPWRQNIRFEVYQDTPEMMSIRIMVDQQIEEPKLETRFYTFTFANRQTNAIQLQDILTETGQEELMKYVRMILAGTLPEQNIILINQGTVWGYNNYTLWNTSPQGVRVVFPKNQVAPHNVEAQEIIIPSETMQLWLRDTYQGML